MKMFITENGTGRELLRPKFFYMYANDIFITKNWAGPELPPPRF